MADAGADLLMLEMMVDTEQAKYALEAAVSTRSPNLGRLQLQAKRGRVAAGTVAWLGETFSESLNTLKGVGGSLVSVMHSVVEVTIPALRVVKEHWDGPWVPIRIPVIS